MWSVVNQFEKIVIVGDDPALYAGLRRRLLGRFTLVTATGSAEAVKALQNMTGIGAIVADMRLPDMTGIALLAKVRARWPAIRRIMLTGNTDHATALAAVADGTVFRFFRKPVDADVLAQALENAIADYRFATNAEAPSRSLDVIASSVQRTRQSFLVMMNHELRTPLNHILGFSALLEQRCKQKGEVESLEYLAYIRESGQALLRTINRILEITRLTAEEFRPDPAVFDLVTMILREVDIHRVEAAERNVTIAFHAPLEALYVNANAQELAQAFVELLDNAIKYNRPGGHIAIAVNGNGDDLAVRIADTGIGMGKAEVSRVMGAFCEPDEGPDRRFDGIGLGVTLAALTAQAYGGSLEVQSRKDHGTAVVLRLKRATAARQSAKIA